MHSISRRSFVGLSAAAGFVAAGAAPAPASDPPALKSRATTRRRQRRRESLVTLDARPGPITIDTAKTAVIVVDMQNDFGAEGGMFHRAGIDISMIRSAVEPTSRVLAAARRVGIKPIYLKMGFRPDLSDAGPADAPNRIKHEPLDVGRAIQAPDGTASRILIRDTWNTDILPPLAPQRGDLVDRNG
jgi:ureidoacrylate peracid hydrolase